MSRHFRNCLPGNFGNASLEKRVHCILSVLVIDGAVKSALSGTDGK